MTGHYTKYCSNSRRDRLRNHYRRQADIFPDTFKANSTVGLIRNTFKHLDKESLLYLYKSLVRPHLEYASVIWSPKIKKHQVSIEKVQRRATRLLPEISHLSYTDRLLTFGLPSLKYRRERTDVIQLFKITYGFDTVSISSTCPICNNPMFKPSLATQTRGHPYSTTYLRTPSQLLFYHSKYDQIKAYQGVAQQTRPISVLILTFPSHNCKQNDQAVVLS